MDTACECTGGTCAKCCLEEYNAATDTYKCFWEDPLVVTVLPPAPPGGYSPSPAGAPPVAPDFGAENVAAETAAADMDAANAAAEAQAAAADAATAAADAASAAAQAQANEAQAAANAAPPLEDEGGAQIFDDPHVRTLTPPQS